MVEHDSCNDASTEHEQPSPAKGKPKVTRRTVLGMAGCGVAGLILGGAL